MKLVWEKYGKPETPYTIENLHDTLSQYAGKAFGDKFFNDHIYNSEMPDYASLLKSMGVLLEQPKDAPYFGTYVSMNADGLGASLLRNTQIGSPAYKANLVNGDVILNINDVPFSEGQKFEEYLKQFMMGELLKVDYTRFGERRTTTMTLTPSPDYSFRLMEDKGQTPSSKMLKQRKDWLKAE